MRLFREPLATQVSWVLPLGLISIALTLLAIGFPRYLTRQHLALLLWACWLFPMVVYFSFTSGLWHTYYLAMLGPALAALLGALTWSFEKLLSEQNHLGTVLVFIFCVANLGSEILILRPYSSYFLGTSILMISLWLAGLALFAARKALLTWVNGLVLFSLLVGPLLWSGLTTFNPQPDVDLPVAGPLPGHNAYGPRGTLLSPTQQALLNYLQANSGSKAYLVATLDSHGAAPFILSSGRPVLTLGGYIGNDNVIRLPQLQTMISSGQLRFILDNGNLSQKAEISTWLRATCSVVNVPGAQASARKVSQSSGGPRNQQFSALYDCGG